MNDAWNSCCNQPRKSHQTIDAVEDSTEAKVIVVGFSVRELVVLVVKQVPCDAIVKVAKEEGHDSRSCCSKGCPGGDTEKINKPCPCASRTLLFWALIRPESSTIRSAACKGRLELIRNLETLSLHLRET